MYITVCRSAWKEKGQETLSAYLKSLKSYSQSLLEFKVNLKKYHNQLLWLIKGNFIQQVLNTFTILGFTIKANLSFIATSVLF